MEVDRVTYHRGKHNFTQLHQTRLRDKRSCSCMHYVWHPGPAFTLPLQHANREKKAARTTQLILLLWKLQMLKETSYRRSISLMWIQPNQEKGGSLMFCTQQSDVTPIFTRNMSNTVLHFKIFWHKSTQVKTMKKHEWKHFFFTIGVKLFNILKIMSLIVTR